VCAQVERAGLVPLRAVLLSGGGPGGWRALPGRRLRGVHLALEASAVQVCAATASHPPML
jgi:hypothetical protein